VRGKGGKAQVVRIGHEAARALDRYLRVRARHAQAWRRELWLGMNNRGPMTANEDLPDDHPPRLAGRGGCVDAPVPPSLQPYLAGPRRQRRDLMELNGWSSPQMLRRYGASARSARARRRNTRRASTRDS
jgi:integrase/recombinase XerD